jgi:hypothetical protein
MAGWATKSRNRLVRLAALATLMVGLGSGPAQASTITHSFSPGVLVQDYLFYLSSASTPYVFRVGFDSVLTSFNLSITDNQVAFTPTPPNPLGAGWECVQMTFAFPAPSNCVGFTAGPAGGLPQSGTDFTGNITIGISYGIFGWPLSGDPVDIGQTDNFSTFMLFAKTNPYEYRIVHYPEVGDAELLDSVHCPGTGSIDECAVANGFPNFVVPEPATFGGVVWGVLGLAVLSRRLKRRA